MRLVKMTRCRAFGYEGRAPNLVPGKANIEGAQLDQNGEQVCFAIVTLPSKRKYSLVVVQNCISINTRLIAKRAI